MRCSFKIKIWYYETLPFAIVVGGFCFVKGATIFDLRIVACRVALTKTQREIADSTSKISKQNIA
jgi:hypothetical protein